MHAIKILRIRLLINKLKYVALVCAEGLLNVVRFDSVFLYWIKMSRQRHVFILFMNEVINRTCYT